MKKQVLFIFFLTAFQAFCSNLVKAENAVPDTLSWAWEVSSTVSTRTKTCTFEFSDNLLVNWGDGVTEWIPDSLSSKVITHVYAAQANYSCSAIGVGISYFKADSRRVLSLDAGKSPGLLYLSCTSNQIASLNLIKNTKLVSLYIGSNNLVDLDLSANTQLQTLTCSDNQLVRLDLSALTGVKKVTCHTNPLVEINLNNRGALSYLSCSACNLSAERLDSIFIHLPALAAAATTKNLFVLNNPGSSSCHSEIATVKNWNLDRVLTQSSFYIPSISCKASDSIQANIYLKNTGPAIAFELDLVVPEGFLLDTLRSHLSVARKGQHILSIVRTAASSQQYKMLAYSMKTKDLLLGVDGAVLTLYLKAPTEIKSYTLDIQKAILLDTLTNKMDISVTDGQVTVGASSLSGDANGDQNVDVTDVVNLVAWINGKHQAGIDPASIDMDGDGLWDVSDIAKLVVLINTGGSMSRSEVVGSGPSLDFLRLYTPGQSLLTNNLFVRQSSFDPTALEICLDNVDEVQAFQADVILPQGLGLEEGSFAQKSDRHSNQIFTVSRVASNRYRMLSYNLTADRAFAGKSGVLAKMKLLGSQEVVDGKYPLILEQSVLTDLDLKTVTSKPYDAVLSFKDGANQDESIVVGTDRESGLWVKGDGLTQVTVWDLDGKILVQKKPDGDNFIRLNLGQGTFLVKARTKNQVLTQKVAVR